MKCTRCGREVGIAVYFEGRVFCSETCLGKWVEIFDNWLSLARKEKNV